ncbi:hypothetical protein niasHT_033016 [Heterodera trifolii]|uniref:Chitin-binding type-2 domain-containing protein n=1 Tax=Heterodera trifolii TaxID=157864 RepID=A0ABD2IHQ5_9BILA
MFAVEAAHQQQLGTPVIGGICKLDTPDVHIGGKQTQFFLRCEPNADSAQGEGVWVVKSRHAGSTAAKIPAAAVVSQQEFEQGEQNSQKIAATKQISSYVCDLVSDAVEHGYCSTSENCLQPVYTDRTAFLQCDPTSRRWMKKHCQSGFNFDFERQACIAHTAKMSHHFRQFPTQVLPHSQRGGGGIVCTFAQCSVADPCNVGSCNNGYCCTAAVGSMPNAVLPIPTNKTFSTSITNNSGIGRPLYPPSSTIAVSASTTVPPIPSILVIELNNNNNNHNDDVIGYDQFRLNDIPSTLIGHIASHSQPLPTIFDHCSSGFHSPIRCGGTSGGECPVGLICELATRFCCPFPPKKQKQRKSIISTNSGGGIGGGVVGTTATGNWAQSLVPNGAKVVRRRTALRRHGRFERNACPGGLPALGPCIGGRCAAPAICASPSNVCCAQSSVPTAIPATVCPDGTQAAGACVNGQCGAGFTCNQGLCCTNSSQTPRCLDGSQSIGACIQGRCGTGYTCTTGNICCPSQLNLCPPGQTSVGQAVNGRCPAGYTNFNGQCCGPQSAQSQVSCSVEDSFGRCDSNQQCAEPGYACDVANNWCCPQVIGDAIGPCIQGEGGNRLCPEGYACVGEGEGQCFRLDTGTCAPEEQSGPCAPDGTCPPGYECIEGFCCQTDAGGANPAAAALRLFHQRRRRRRASSASSTSAFLQMINYDRGSRQPTQNRNSQK